MSSTIIGVLADIGADNIEFQTLSQSILRFKNTKNDSEVTFVCPKEQLNSKEAVIVWVDKAAFKDSITKLTSKQAQDETSYK